MRRLPGRILALTPGDLRDATVASFVNRARGAIEAGLESILVREPSLSDRATTSLARELRALLGRRGWLAIHDRVHLAPIVDADAVHLGFRSLSIEVARAILPDECAVGFSAHTHDERSAHRGADYLVFGPVFPTRSKFGVLDAVGVDGLERAALDTDVPIWALGGIDAANAAECARRCRGIAVRGALLGAEDPLLAWRSLQVAVVVAGAGP